MRTAEKIIFTIIGLAFLIGIFLYPTMPNNMQSHWDSKGVSDGYMTKEWGLFFIPIVMLACYLLFRLFPKIDPLKANFKKFDKYYDHFMIAFVSFLFYIFSLTLIWNMGVKFNMIQLMSPAFGLLFFYTGIMTENVKQNWFMGIKTPWTLSDEKTWNKTHKLGGKMFKVASLFAFFGIFLPDMGVMLIVAPLLFVAVFLIWYSYSIYPKEKPIKSYRQQMTASKPKPLHKVVKNPKKKSKKVSTKKKKK